MNLFIYLYNFEFYIVRNLATFDISEEFPNKRFVKKIMQTFDISKGSPIRDISDSFFSMYFELKF